MMSEIGKMSEQLKMLSEKIDHHEEPHIVETTSTENHEELVKQECETAKEVESAPLKNLKPWKSIPLKDRVGQFGRDKCEKVEKVVS